MDNEMERERRERSVVPKEDGADSIDRGPRRPKVARPGNDDILKRMRRVDPDQAKRYRQRTGQ